MTDEKYTTWEDVALSLTVDQAAAVLGVHPNTIRNVIKSGKLRAQKIGREWRISKADLKRYLEGKDGEPT